MTQADRATELFEQVWAETLTAETGNDRSRGYAPAQYYTSGRASREFPGKEDPSWWFAKGPGFIKSWVQWRDRCGLDIWAAPTGEPGIELQVYSPRGGGVLSIIDRVMVDADGNLYIIDLKTGSSTPAWPRQLALNNLGLLDTFDTWAQFGGFWNARKGSVDLFDLRIYDPEWLATQVSMAREIRDRRLFVAQPTNLCNSACSVREYCKAVGGSLSLSIMQPSHTDEVPG